MRNPFEKKKLKSPSILKRNPNKKFYLQFYMKNPFKINQPAFNFTKEIPLKFCRKKMVPEILSQKYHLGPTSWRPFLKKSSQ